MHSKGRSVRSKKEYHADMLNINILIQSILRCGDSDKENPTMSVSGVSAELLI